MEHIKIKIIVAIDEDGNEEEREVNLDQAIAFLKNQLEGLEQVKRQKKNLDLERAQRLMKEAEEAMRKAQEKEYEDSDDITIPNPWGTQPYTPGTPIWIDTTKPFIHTDTISTPNITWGGTSTGTSTDITYTNCDSTSFDNTTNAFTIVEN